MSEKVRGYTSPRGERGVYVPDFVISLWRIEFKEKYGIDVDRDVARIILQTKYENTTWKWRKAIKRIEEILVNKGLSRENAMHFAKHIVDLALQ